MILAIETTLKEGSIAISSEGNLLGSRKFSEEVSMSKDLLKEIDLLLNETGIFLNDIKLIGVSTGPGSLTGIRIGISLTKGLAFSLGIEWTAVSILEAMGRKSKCDDSISIISGGKEYSYWQINRKEERGSTEIIKNQDIPVLLNEYSKMEFIIDQRLLNLLNLSNNCEIEIHSISNFSEIVAEETFLKLMNDELSVSVPNYGKEESFLKTRV